ncbi:MAG: transposase family protein, partial [Desulfobacterales bacterium]|nr:transposase family protein [Desulfobacterales bacterium]
TGKRQQWVTKKPFEILHIDVVGPMPVTPDGNRYLVTMRDRFSGFVRAIPVSSASARNCALVLVSEWFNLFGCPKMLLSDRGSEFLNSIFDILERIYQIKRVVTTSYHPETNGFLERWHRFLKEYFRTHYISKGTALNEWASWDWVVYQVVGAYNATKSPRMGFSPFKLLFGRNFLMPPDVSMILSDMPITTKDKETDLGEFMRILKDSQHVIRKQA